MITEDLSVPARIGPYPIIEQIGAGGFGEVFLAKQLELDRLVVITRMHADNSCDERFLSFFYGEMKITADLTHPNIVQIITVGRDDDQRPYMVMEVASDAPRALRDLIERLIQPRDERLANAQGVEWLARAVLGLPMHRGTLARLVQATAGPKETLTWEPFDWQDPEDPDDPEQAA
jgi:serine/threonine protein kinase